MCNVRIGDLLPHGDCVRCEQAREKFEQKHYLNKIHGMDLVLQETNTITSKKCVGRNDMIRRLDKVSRGIRFPRLLRLFHTSTFEAYFVTKALGDEVVAVTDCAEHRSQHCQILQL